MNSGQIIHVSPTYCFVLDLCQQKLAKIMICNVLHHLKKQTNIQIQEGKVKVSMRKVIVVLKADNCVRHILCGNLQGLHMFKRTSWFRLKID